MELVIQSTDRTTGTDASSYSVHLPPGSGFLLGNYTEVGLSMLEMNENRYTLTSTNNTLYLDVINYTNTGVATDTVYNIVIPVGSYDPSTLAATLQTAIPIQFAQQCLLFPLPTLVVTVTYNMATQYFTINVAAGLYGSAVLLSGVYPFLSVLNTTRWASLKTLLSLPTWQNSLNYLMGFDSVYYPSNLAGGVGPFIGVTNNVTSTNQERLGNLGMLYLCSDLVQNSVITSSQTTDVRQILAAVPSANFGNTLLYEPAHEIYFPLRKDMSSTQSVGIYWLDYTYTRPNFTAGNEHSIILKFR